MTAQPPTDRPTEAAPRSRRTPAGRSRGATPPRGPDPARLAAVVALAWLEVVSGQRSRRQLDPVLSPALRRRLAGQVTDGVHRDGAVRLRRVVSCEPRSGAVEAAVLIEHDGRTSALAVRLERHLGAWRVVELSAPETGLRPLATASLVRRSAPDAFDDVLMEHRPADPTRASGQADEPDAQGTDRDAGSGSVAALELLAAPTGAGVVAADLVVGGVRRASGDPPNR